MPTRPADDVTTAIAEYAVRQDLSTLPGDAVELTRRSLLDTLGVTLAARADEGVRILRSSQAAGRPGDEATLLVDGSRTGAATAALVNGMAAHALDFDDVTEIIYGHPSAALWPAILAAAEAGRNTEREVIEAFNAGFATMVAVAASMDVRAHYSRGWHSTSTVGVLGATLAVARLQRLDLDAARRALGLATSFAGGSRQNFGTTTKPLHVGLTGRDAVVACDLAARGFTADPAILDGPLGYFSMFADAADPAQAIQVLKGASPLVEQGLNVKKYPCCFNTHRTADAVLDLAGRDSVRAYEVRAVRVTMEPGGFDPLIHHRPQTGLEGKFSAEYIVAAGLLDGRIRLASFTDEAVRRPEAQALIEKVTYAESDVPPVDGRQWTYAFSVVEIATTRGEFAFRTDIPRGDHRLPLDRAGLTEKFRDCAAACGAGWDTDALMDEIWNFGGPREFTGFAQLRARW